MNETHKDGVSKLFSDFYVECRSNIDSIKEMEEDEALEKVASMYNKIYTSFENSFAKKGKKGLFSVNDFLDGVVGRMRQSMTTPRKYSAKTINKIVEFPYNNKEELLRMSLYFYVKTQEYKGIIEYKSSMLTYSNVLYPVGVVNESFNKEEYLKNLQMIKDYNLESKLGYATKMLVRDDVYFAYEVSDSTGKNFIWKKLPNEYCTILGRDRFETYRVGFDMKYFDKYPADLKSFPPEFQDIYYNKYKKNKDSFGQKKDKNNGKKKKGMTLSDLAKGDYDSELISIYELDNSKAIAFKFDESIDYVLPYYSGMFLDLVRLSDLKDVEVISAVSDNYKLLHQLIPLNKESQKEDDFLISGEFLRDFHSNLVDNTPEGVGAVTTPMPIEAITLKGNVNSAEENLTGKQVTNILTQSGTSSLLFNGSSTSAMGLNKNIQVDENMMFKVLRQYELYMRKRLYHYNRKTYKYELQFLNHTHFNTENLQNWYLKASQFGFNFEFELNAILGRKQIDFINSGTIMDKLGLKDSMIPLKSSHVGDTSEGENGNKKTEEELSEDGAISRDRDL